MNKNYYDILQINQNASPEIIEKAYKTLAKKYHPDLQEESNKKEAEEILKEINEAYEILSNPDKKALYDQNLKDETISNINLNSFNSTTNENPETDIDQKKFDEIRKEQQELEYKRQQLQYQEQMEQARQKAYHDAYIQDLKNRGYKIKYKKSFKDYLKGIISIIIVIIILILLWHVPFIQNFFMNLYENNESIHYAVDIFTNLFN